MKEYDLKIKIKLSDDKDVIVEEVIKKYFSEKLSPEIKAELRKILFLRKEEFSSNWGIFKKYAAGLFPSALMDKFDKSRAIDYLGSRVRYEKRTDTLEINAQLTEDVKKQFESDPVPYILKAVAGITPEKADQIWQEVLEKSIEEAKK